MPTNYCVIGRTKNPLLRKPNNCIGSNRMERKVARASLLLLAAFSLLTSAACTADDDGDYPDGEQDMRRFHSSRERHCHYRRKDGVCKRRSQCENPSRRICRFSISDPIVCCMDIPSLKPPRKPQPAPRPPPPASRPPPTASRPSPTASRPSPTASRPPATRFPKKPPPTNLEKIDILFPGCGTRSPQGNKPTTSASGGILDRLLGTGSQTQMFRPVVVGGRDSKPHSWPWMVAVFRQSLSGNRFLCGASLISRRFVITAAHCFDAEKRPLDPSKFSVMLGSHRTNDGAEYPVGAVVLHPQYRARQYYNDLALLEIGRPVALSATVHPVCLPSDSLRDKIRLSNTNVTVTGWGDTTFGGVNSKYLQEASMPIVRLKECNESYWGVVKAHFPMGITNNFICAGLQEGGKDACQGDSGGPLVSELSDKKWVQLGVVSFGYGCAQPGFPGVYTRLSSFAKWLHENSDLGDRLQ